MAVDVLERQGISQEDWGQSQGQNIGWISLCNPNGL